MIIFLLHVMLIYVGFWLQVGGSQGSPWKLLETHFLTFGGLDWLWGLTLGGLDWLLGPRWPQDPPKTLQDPSKRPPRPILGPKLMDFGAPTGWIWGQFGWMFVPTWSDIWYKDKIGLMP